MNGTFHIIRVPANIEVYEEINIGKYSLYSESLIEGVSKPKVKSSFDIEF